MEARELARYIDHTLLKPEAKGSDIEKLCDEAIRHGFFSVCVQPYRVALAYQAINGSETRVCSVIGFPHGANRPEAKRFEAEFALRDGASELDMVMNIGAAKQGDWAYVERETGSLVELANQHKALVKVIIECALLTDDEKRRATEAVCNAGAAFVKTSTGYAAHGATLEDVRLMHQVAAGRCQVKAAGGVRDFASAQAMIEAGASRLGTSNGIAIIEGLTAAAGY